MITSHTYYPRYAIEDHPPGTIIKAGINNCVACQLTDMTLKKLNAANPEANIVTYHVEDEDIVFFADTYEVKSFPYIALRHTDSTEIITSREASVSRLTKFIKENE